MKNKKRVLMLGAFFVVIFVLSFWLKGVFYQVHLVPSTLNPKYFISGCFIAFVWGCIVSHLVSLKELKL
ncbi:hypothetical protein KKH36_02245 [Patescibacteria group bacterium]|nr:hypothetical protein [Patescibacteria group bacterium]